MISTIADNIADFRHHRYLSLYIVQHSPVKDFVQFEKAVDARSNFDQISKVLEIPKID